MSESQRTEPIYVDRISGERFKNAREMVDQYIHRFSKRVVSDMLGLHVHRLFVVDAAGVLVGVISTMDVLRHLKAEP